MPTDPFVELRGEILRDHVDVIDAVATAKGSNRMAVLRAIVADWVDRKTHEAMLIQRVTKGNGTAPESDRNRAGRIAE